MTPVQVVSSAPPPGSGDRASPGTRSSARSSSPTVMASPRSREERLPLEPEHDGGRGLDRFARRRVLLHHDAGALQARGQPKLREHAQRVARAHAREIRERPWPRRTAIRRAARSAARVLGPDAGCSDVSLGRDAQQRLRRIDRRRHAVVAQRRVGDLLKDRRGDDAAVRVRRGAANRRPRRSRTPAFATARSRQTTRCSRSGRDSCRSTSFFAVPVLPATV